MKSTVEQLSPTRVRINVEVPFEELQPDFDRAFQSLAGQVRIPGFRPGKAPRKILEARVGRGAVLEQVVNDAIQSRYNEAVTSNEVKVLGQPEIDVTKLEDNDTLEFTAEVDVAPQLELPALDELAVTVEITDEDIEEQLLSLRQRFGTLKGVERPVQNGDFVSIDLSATVDGEEVTEAATEGLSHEVGSGQLIDGLDDAIIGTSAGESKDFNSTLLAGEFAGKEAVVTVKVNSVKERELPEADDDFAQLASEFDTLDELTADLRERVERVKKVEQAGQIRDKVLDAGTPEVVEDTTLGSDGASIDGRLKAHHFGCHDGRRTGHCVEARRAAVNRLEDRPVRGRGIGSAPGIERVPDEAHRRKRLEDLVSGGLGDRRQVEADGRGKVGDQ